MQPEIQKLKQEIAEIKLRNKRVEADKAWETSWSRKVMIAVITYITVLIFFFTIKVEQPFVNAIVPTLGFLLSTLSIPLIKNLWLKYVYK